MSDIAGMVEAFLRSGGSHGDGFFNEAELQHELGCWLRATCPWARVYFERPAHCFIPGAKGLIKKEIDLVVAPQDNTWFFAIELKCPRNGRVPETMFDACIDLQFLEQLVAAGFWGGLFAIHVSDPDFYRGRVGTGIYSYFRRGALLNGAIQKPTKSQTNKGPRQAILSSSYSVKWRSSGECDQYWLQQLGGLQPPQHLLA